MHAHVMCLYKVDYSQTCKCKVLWLVGSTLSSLAVGLMLRTYVW